MARNVEESIPEATGYQLEAIRTIENVECRRLDAKKANGSRKVVGSSPFADKGFLHEISAEMNLCQSLLCVTTIWFGFLYQMF